jgi:hypothetical protein
VRTPPPLALTDRDQLFLRAGIHRDERAIEAWGSLRSDFDLDELTFDEYRMVPLLYRNLSALGVKDERFGSLKGIYLHSWYRNLLLLRRMAQVLRELDAAGIPTLALKGTALVAGYYKDPGVRPMGDFDVLVPQYARAKSLEVIERLGWGEEDSRVRDLRLGYYHSIDLAGGEPFACDLHWQLMHYLLLPDDPDRSADDFWEAAEGIEIVDVPTRALCPADQLLHVCAHGARWDSDTTLCWLADAATILAVGGGRLDWRRLVSQAGRRRSVLAVRTAMTTLASFGFDVPPDVLGQLAQLPIGRREARSHRPFVSRAQRRARPTLLGITLDMLETYVRLTTNWNARRTATAFPSFVLNRLDLDHAWQLPLFVARRTTRAISARGNGCEG